MLRDLQRKIAFGIAAGLVGFVAALAVVAYLSLSVYFWLAGSMPPAEAAALTALVVLIAAVLIIVILRLFASPRSAPRTRAHAQSQSHSHSQSQTQQGPDSADIAAQIGSLLGGTAQGFASKHKSATIVSSLALGFIIGMNPNLRDLFRRGL